MPTKRKRVARYRLEPIPEWADRLLTEKRIPERGTADYDDYVGWAFFGDSVPGLPDEETSEGKRLHHQVMGT